jgi:hypothetical protein
VTGDQPIVWDWCAESGSAGGASLLHVRGRGVTGAIGDGLDAARRGVDAVAARLAVDAVAARQALPTDLTVNRIVFAAPAAVADAFDAWIASGVIELPAAGTSLRVAGRVADPSPALVRRLEGDLRLRGWRRRLPVRVDVLTWWHGRTVISVTPARARWMPGARRRDRYFAAGHAVTERIRTEVETRLAAG